MLAIYVSILTLLAKGLYVQYVMDLWESPGGE